MSNFDKLENVKVTWSNGGIHVYPETRAEHAAIVGVCKVLQEHLPGAYVDQRVDPFGIPRQLRDEEPVALPEHLLKIFEDPLGDRPSSQNGSNRVLGSAGHSPSDVVAGVNDDERILSMQEWHKPGSELAGRPETLYDPATGKHFYTCNGVKVFTD